MAKKELLGYGSYIIVHCPECGAPARLVCVLCKKGVCQEHQSFLNEHPCIHQRHYHENDALRLVTDRGFVDADQVTFFS